MNIPTLETRADDAQDNAASSDIWHQASPTLTRFLASKAVMNSGSLCPEPTFPKSHGKPPVDDTRVLRGITFINRNGLRWEDAPSVYGPHRPFTAVGSGGVTRASLRGCCSNLPVRAAEPRRS